MLTVLLVVGQVDLDDGSLAQATVDADGAAVGLDDPVDDGHPHARPLTGALGGEERFEELGQGVRGHALAIVLHGQTDHGSGCQIGQLAAPQPVDWSGVKLHGERVPLPLHRVIGVGAQIHHHLLQLGGVAQDRVPLYRELLLDVDGGGDRLAEELQRFLDDLVEPYRLPGVASRPTEGEDLRDELLCPARGT